MQLSRNFLLGSTILLAVVVVSNANSCRPDLIQSSLMATNKGLTELQRLIGSWYTLTLVPGAVPANLQRTIQNFWSDMGNRTAKYQYSLMSLMGCIGRDSAGLCNPGVFEGIEAGIVEMSGIVMGISAQTQGRVSTSMTDAIDSVNPQFYAAYAITSNNLNGCLSQPGR